MPSTEVPIHGRRFWPAAAIVGAVSLLVACGSGGAPSPHPTQARTPTPKPAGPMLTGVVATAEQVTLSTGFSAPIQVLVHQSATPAPAGTTCAQYAAGAAGTFLAPQFDVIDDNHSLYFQGVVASGYTGPGAYSSGTTPQLGGTVSVGVGVGTGQLPAYSIFRSTINGSSTLTVRDDGSGTFEFSEWGSTEVRGNTGSAASISGTVTWKCG